jgi:hypothetical protein
VLSGCVCCERLDFELPSRTRRPLSGHAIEEFIGYFFFKLSKIEVSENPGFPARMFYRRLLVCCVPDGS